MTQSFEMDKQVDVSRGAVSLAVADAVTKSFGDLAQLPAQALYGLLERPPEAHLGDYALPCFRLAKELKRKPQELAAELASVLNQLAGPWVEKAEAVGAFLNIHVRPGTLAKNLIPSLKSGTAITRIPKCFAARPKVMIEYSQPNTHKVFHVGHMRNVALGDSLGRLYEACGYPVVMANYIGDEGAHIAKCLWYIKRSGEHVPESAKGVWLGGMYVAADRLLESATPEQLPIFQQEISQILRDIESKQGDTYKFWLESRQWSLDDFNEIYSWIGARFDHVFCESEVSEESQTIVDQFLQKGVFVPSDGAIGVDLKEEKLGFVIVRKSDGNTTYATKDLALAGRKYTQFHVEKSIYVVASEQNLHFKQVFRVLEKMGFPQAKNCYHLSYGMVVAPDGKMSSRKGNTITFSDLRDKLGAELDKNLDKYRGEWPEAEIQTIKHRLAVGAIRYGMICSDPVKDIVFNLEDWLSFEGNTGPYLMYSFARTRSILRKAADQGWVADDNALEVLGLAEERELLRYLNDIPNIIVQSCEQNKPSILCHHLFDTCKVYNRLLAQVSILRSESDQLRAARLSLLEAFCEGLRSGLSLLGITPPERM